MYVDFIFNHIVVHKLLACEPSAAQVSPSYSRRLPALGRFYQENKFSLKSLPTPLGISKPSEEHFCSSPEFPNQNLSQILRSDKLLLLLKDNPSFNEIGVGAPNRRNNVSIKQALNLH